MIDFINWRIIYYGGGLILYRKSVDSDLNINVEIKLIYLVTIASYLITRDNYLLTDKLTLKSLISTYKKLIDGYNTISKNK